MNWTSRIEVMIMNENLIKITAELWFIPFDILMIVCNILTSFWQWANISTWISLHQWNDQYLQCWQSNLSNTSLIFFLFDLCSSLYLSNSYVNAYIHLFQINSICTWNEWSCHTRKYIIACKTFKSGGTQNSFEFFLSKSVFTSHIWTQGGHSQ